MKETARLIDAAERHRLAPPTFEVPDAGKLAGLGRGDLAKIGVTFPETDGIDGERFWVEVVERRGDEFVGRVDNDLHFTGSHGLQLNDPIAFDVRHVLDVDILTPARQQAGRVARERWPFPIPAAWSTSRAASSSDGAS